MNLRPFEPALPPILDGRHRIRTCDIPDGHRGALTSPSHQCTRWDSNLQPLQCECSALTIELRVQFIGVGTSPKYIHILNNFNRKVNVSDFGLQTSLARRSLGVGEEFGLRPIADSRKLMAESAILECFN